MILHCCICKCIFKMAKDLLYFNACAFVDNFSKHKFWLCGGKEFAYHNTMYSQSIGHAVFQFVNCIICIICASLPEWNPYICIYTRIYACACAYLIEDTVHKTPFQLLLVIKLNFYFTYRHNVHILLANIKETKKNFSVIF